MTGSIGGRLGHFTPLRYPGGKGKLAAYVKEIVTVNGLSDGEYVEPYAGGAAVAMELLLQEFVSHVHINDISNSVYLFWKCVLERPEELCKLIVDTPRTVDEWDKQKKIIRTADQQDSVDVAFAFFFLNRTNRSGILNAGIIGGRDQNGPWKIDARFNAEDLVNRIQSIARVRDRISLSSLDAAAFLKRGYKKWSRNTLIYCDPPYYVKGRELYYDYYRHDDHLEIAEVMASMSDLPWIVSYDNVPQIHEMYRAHKHVTYNIGYSARNARQGSEVMFFSSSLQIPTMVGSASEISRSA